MPKSSTTALLKKLYASKSGILVLATCIVAAGLLIVGVQSKSDTPRAVLISIAASLFAAAVFSAAHSYFTSNELAELIKEQQREGSLEVLEEARTTISSLFPTYFPNETYKSTNLADTTFSEHVNRDLVASRVYDFVGLSGKFVPARIRSVGCNLELLRLEVADITDETSMKGRLRYETSVNGVHKSFDTALREARQNLLASLVGLFSVRSQVQKIEILFSVRVPPGRFEALDNAIYLTPFDGNWSTRRQYPASYRFGVDSLHLRMHRRDFITKFEGPDTTKLWRITADESEREFRDRLANIGLPASENEFSEAMVEFERRVPVFSGLPRRAS